MMEQHLKLETESIWKRNCLRDFLDVRRSYEQGEHRKETSSWRRLYFVRSYLPRPAWTRLA